MPGPKKLTLAEKRAARQKARNALLWEAARKGSRKARGVIAKEAKS